LVASDPTVEIVTRDNLYELVRAEIEAANQNLALRKPSPSLSFKENILKVSFLAFVCCFFFPPPHFVLLLH
jgi:hypothetical protein